MQAVYFGQELNKRAPDIVGCLYLDPAAKWVTLFDLVAAMDRGETITIRPASQSEMKRAECLVALYEISWQLGAKIGELLDGKPKEALAAVTAIRDATEATLNDEIAPINWLDQHAKEPNGGR